MRIIPVNSMNFGAKNSRIRAADDIMRKSKAIFPLVSATYIDTFYNGQADKKLTVSRNIKNEIERYRDIYLSKNPFSKEIEISRKDEFTPFGVLLKCISKSKKGDCAESSAMVLAALAANGYYDSKRMSLYLKTEYYDKKNNKKVYSHLADLDHNFVVTSMGKNSNEEKDLVVIDPWLSFSDSISGAKAKFKQLLYEDCIAPVEKQEREAFIRKMNAHNKNIDVDKDYKLRQKFVFLSSDIMVQSEIEQLGEYAKTMYPGLILSQTENNEEHN